MELATNVPAGRSVREGDAGLWSRSLAGDGDAFGALFDRHRDRVFRHACRLADTRQDAEDVVAASFLELWRRRAKVRLVDGSVLPWLLVTTTNLGRNAARSRRRYRQFLDRLPRDGNQPDVAEVVVDGGALGIDPRLRAGLRALGREDAQLFVLVALEGYSVATAAEQLRLSVSAARSRLHRIRARLRDELDEGLVAGGSNDRGGGR